MNHEREIHLSEDQLIRAIVDKADLSLHLQEHLSLCSDCRRAKELLEGDITELDHTARDYMPMPKRQMYVSLKPSRRVFLRSWKWQASLGMAATALIVFFVAWGANFIPFTTGENRYMAALDISEADALITEINILMKNAIPQVYLEICGASELDNTEILDEKFLEFIAPISENNTLSS